MPTECFSFWEECSPWLRLILNSSLDSFPHSFYSELGLECSFDSTAAITDSTVVDTIVTDSGWQQLAKNLSTYFSMDYLIFHFSFSHIL